MPAYPLAFYLRPGVMETAVHVRDARGRHWTATKRQGEWVVRPYRQRGTKYYGRVNWRTNAPRMHFKPGLELVDPSKTSTATIQHGYVANRNGRPKTQEMANLFPAQQQPPASATEYATALGHIHNPPVRYEWCHLISHGLGGPDTSDNLVAATAFQNTEQLA